MAVSNTHLTAIGIMLWQSIEKLYDDKSKTFLALDLPTAQALFAITQELVSFRLDYPDVTYAKAIEDQYGVRGEQ